MKKIVLALALVSFVFANQLMAGDEKSKKSCSSSEKKSCCAKSKDKSCEKKESEKTDTQKTESEKK